MITKMDSLLDRVTMYRLVLYYLLGLLGVAILYSTLGIINPVLNQRINWLWFVLSQVGFGIVAGIVVSRQERVRTWQRLPFAVRAGIEAPGMMHEHREDRGG